MGTQNEVHATGFAESWIDSFDPGKKETKNHCCRIAVVYWCAARLLLFIWVCTFRDKQVSRVFVDLLAYLLFTAEGGSARTTVKSGYTAYPFNTFEDTEKDHVPTQAHQISKSYKRFDHPYSIVTFYFYDFHVGNSLRTTFPSKVYFEQKCLNSEFFLLFLLPRKKTAINKFSAGFLECSISNYDFISSDALKQEQKSGKKSKAKEKCIKRNNF